MSRAATWQSVFNGQTGNLALAALIGGGITIGFAPILVRLSQVGPAATAFWRLVLALPVLWLWLVAAPDGLRPARRPTRRADYRLLLLAGLFFAGDIVNWHWSLGLTTVANATLLVNFAPIFVTLGSWLLFRQRISLIFGVGMAVALAGATLLIGASFTLSRQYFWGDFLAVVAAAFYAAYMLSIKVLREKFSVATIMGWSGLSMVAALGVITLLSGETVRPFSVLGWLVLLALAWLIHIGGQGLIAFAMAHLPASFSSVTLLVQPVTATVLAWLLLAEVIGPWQAVGGGLVLLGIFVARRGSRTG
ncbi:MAG: DMT family transporter [Chloroflexota bacterium]